MNSEKEIKEIVKEKYGQIAEQKTQCGCGGCCGPQSVEINMIGDDYKDINGRFAGADLGLGCGIPTEYADIKQDDVVLDLGSGAGNDVFIARALVGNGGKVYGVDMTEQMISKANLNNQKLGYTNIEFRLGEIESLPIESNSIDVVLSNCVLNLVPNKETAFLEIFRVLKNGAHFCISDIVLNGKLPEGLKKSAEMYTGCVAGALQQEEYLGVIRKIGFKEIRVVMSKKIELPNELLQKYLSNEKPDNNDVFGIFSITVKGIK